MEEKRRLFGTNGIRGIVNENLTAEMTVKIGSAIGNFFKNGNLIVGHDARLTSPMLVKALISGLNATGINVLYMGMAPTPALQYAVKNHSADGAVIITASHNPPEYNGIKVVYSDGIELPSNKEIEIEKIFYKGNIKLSKWNAIGVTRKIPKVNDDYIEAIKKHVEVSLISNRKFHIIVDPANSVGSLTAPKLLQELGCKITTINANIDGSFPGRLPEPRPENLADLALIVKVLKADLGVAYDGDADRAIFVDNQGKIIHGDKTFALVAKDYLINNPDAKIVTPISSSNIINDIAERYNGNIIVTPVGSTKVSQSMKKLKAKLGGEENGGIFYGPHQSVRDGTMATALILNIMAKTNKELSELINELPKYYIEKTKLKCPEENKKAVLERMIEETKKLNVNKIDGIKIIFEEGSTILIRPSGTEPIYRLFVEAKTKERTKKLLKIYKLKLKRIIKNLN